MVLLSVVVSLICLRVVVVDLLQLGVPSDFVTVVVNFVVVLRFVSVR